MTTLNDEIVRATGGPTVNDGLATHFSKTATESIQDAEARFLFAQAAVTVKGNLTDMWYQFLRASFTGSVGDMKLQYWTAQ